MIPTNDYFKNIERAPYELGHLLKALPHHLHGGLPTVELVDMASAAEIHASNACDTVMTGLESIGKLLFLAGANEEWPLEPGHLRGIGTLIQHLAVEAEFYCEQVATMQEALKARDSIAAPVQKGGPV